jgi:asparagine synthase (glutamine-hydrolysing)
MLYPAESARHPAPWSIEFWRPFADRRLQSFLLAIPPEQKFLPHPESDHFYSGSKQIVRRGMKGILPESIRTRVAKTYFTSSVEMEVQTAWPDYEATFGPSTTSEIARHGYVDREKFWERLQQLRDGSGGQDFMYVMSLVQLETWLRSLALSREQLSAVPPVWGREEPAPAGALS